MCCFGVGVGSSVSACSYDEAICLQRGLPQQLKNLQIPRSSLAINRRNAREMHNFSVCIILYIWL